MKEREERKWKQDKLTTLLGVKNIERAVGGKGCEVQEGIFFF